MIIMYNLLKTKTPSMWIYRASLAYLQMRTGFKIISYYHLKAAIETNSRLPKFSLLLEL